MQRIITLKNSGYIATNFHYDVIMFISRDKYLNDLINIMHNGLIKVVTGIRRSGK